ncbi:MAG: DUF4406 domain-containing protein [Sphingobacteriales bacterium]|nr:DUF4406 domain-containing protein [Sphingobacteriales bacterium]
MDNIEKAFEPQHRTLAKTIGEIAKFSDKPVVYIAGKVTGLPFDEVKEKFHTAHRMLEQKGYYVINPVAIVHPEADWKEAMRICISFLPHADFIYPLPCWIHSEGATIEVKLAVNLGIPRLKL